MGLGCFGGGVAAARWVARRGAVVTVTDLADERSLAESLASLGGESIDRFRLSGHHEVDFREADMVIVNPAVRPGNRYVELAREHGARITSEVELFLEGCPARVIGVTGSNGKSTTAAMIAAILGADGRTIWLGGNIGVSLLDRLDEMTADDWVVIELSSFQLWHLGRGAKVPQVAVVTNCSPNHLNWHDSFQDYVTAKKRIIGEQTPGDMAVLGVVGPQAAEWHAAVRGTLLPLVPEADLPELAVSGTHNRANAVCAATAAGGVGCDCHAICQGLESFLGLPGRLELIRTVAGRSLYNDTTSTTPDSTIAALATLGRRSWLMAGGVDKGLDFVPMSAAVIRYSRGAAFFGSVGNLLAEQVHARSKDFRCIVSQTMAEALRWCWERSEAGDAIVLSPGCSSHDQFRNFRDRGRRFEELVDQLPAG
jgi:UDP-N-acetylmuramoylalanine--D-glutamate ligase